MENEFKQELATAKLEATKTEYGLEQRISSTEQDLSATKKELVSVKTAKIKN